MGYMMLLATCGLCASPFMCNPDYVPSLHLRDGSQLVFCQLCIEFLNVERAKKNLPPNPIHPNAYEVQEA
jgi:hypothetical protein